MNQIRFYLESSTSNGILVYGFLIIAIVCMILECTLVSCTSNTKKHRRISETKEVTPADQIVMEMKSGLNLSNEQESNILPIIEEQVKRRKGLIEKFKGQGHPGLEDLRYELKVLRISTENQLQYFLTNDQMIKYGNMQQEEDQRITSEKPKEQEGQQMRKGRGRRSGGF